MGEQPDALRALLHAVVSVSDTHDVSDVLQRVVSTACAITGARYGAFVVLDPSPRAIGALVTHGVSDEERELIARLPAGEGVLRLVLDASGPVRLLDVAAHPAFAGFPPGHPPVTTFLGVPVHDDGTLTGQLYLVDKADGSEFTPGDEDLLVTLAATAGGAIARARAHAASLRREGWLQASTEITNALLSQVRRGDAIAFIARRARQVAGADLALVLLRHDGELLVECVDGPGSRVAAGDRVTAQGAIGHVAAGGDAVRTLGDPGALALGVERALIAPLRTSTGALGVLVVATGRDVGVDPDDELSMVAGFAEQAAVALELAHAQADRARVAVFLDRDRIARDLHDLIAQRLYAVGLMLKVVERLEIDQEERVRRIEEIRDELDGAVKDLRRAIYSLHRGPGRGNLEGDVRDTVGAVTPSLGFAPSVSVTGPVGDVPEPVSDHLVAVLREALSNVARHAAATWASVVVEVGRDVVLTVTDDGRGYSGGPDGSGLPNARHRAASLGGTCMIGATGGRGTRLRWRVPVSAAAVLDT